MLLIFKFLLISSIFVQNVFAKNCQFCGHKMEGHKIKREFSLLDGQQINVEFDSIEIGNGAFSLVYHATIKNAENINFNGKPMKKCLALKYTNIEERRKGQEILAEKAQENEWKMLKMFGQIGAKHIVKLFASGTIEAESSIRMHSLMELGNKDGEAKNYQGHIERKYLEWASMGWDKMDDWKIEREIEEVALTMRDIHQRAIHLDFKPQNLIYVKNEHNENILKAIDFGGSHPIPAKYSPNLPIFIHEDDLIFTSGFESPELERKGRMVNEGGMVKVTMKADIWAIGVILMGLAAKKFTKNIVEREVKILTAYKTFDIYLMNMNDEQFMDWIIRRYKRHSGDWGKELGEKWAECYELFKLILGIRKCCPRVFHLITATLQLNPAKRPTANGILDFLGQKCIFDSQMPDSESRMEFLPGLTLSALKKWLQGKIKKNEAKFQEWKGILNKLGGWPFLDKFGGWAILGRMVGFNEEYKNFIKYNELLEMTNDADESAKNGKECEK